MAVRSMGLKTLVYQSAPPEGHRPAWMGRCLRSVSDWAAGKGFSYRFYDDQFLDLVPSDLTQRTKGRRQMVADLARLILAQQLFKEEDWDRVIWADADFLVFDPDMLCVDRPELVKLGRRAYALGQETWVQPGKTSSADPKELAAVKGGWKIRRNVHNAFMVFGRENPMLDFYCHAACQLLSRQPLQGEAKVPPQFLGPKLLGNLHSLTDFPLLACAGAISPHVMADLAEESGKKNGALDAFSRALAEPLGGANLCASLWPKDQGEALVERVITRLLQQKQTIFTGTDH